MNIINPATGENIAQLTEDSGFEVRKKVEQLRAAHKGWAAKSIDERLSLIVAFGELMISRKDELADIMTAETGKPIQQSHNEIGGAVNRIDHLKSQALKWLLPEQISHGDTREEISYEPLGVIANISAWNFPYNVGFNVFLYALVSGNCVLYKPSEYASLTGQKFGEMLWEVGVPKDIFALAIGGAPVGEAILEARCDGYFFTGSHKTGQHIAERVAPYLVPVQLELGGKDPLYIADDVLDVRQAAINAAEGAFYNNGQSCCAVERIYVHQNIHDEFVNHFVAEVESYKIGEPHDRSTFIGPLTREPQIGVILDQIRDAVAKGAIVLTGGKRMSREGYYLEPTVLKNVTHEMAIMHDESFGPVIGIQLVADDDEAVELMLDTTFGLTSAVFSANEARAKSILSSMNSGTVYWNCCDRVSPNLPWSGRKNSGLGSTLSYHGIRAFVQPKAWHLRD